MKDEINDLINKLVSYPKFNIGKYLLHDTVITQSKKIVTDSIKANAELQALSGLKPKIVRKSSGNCCKWCEEIAGTYIYPNVPDDVYRRHRGCTCTVEYFPGDGRVQNVHSKEWYKAESERTKEWYEERQKRVVNNEYSDIIKSLDIDDFDVKAEGRGIDSEVLDVIKNTIKTYEAKGGMYISDVHFGEFFDDNGKTALLQIIPAAYGGYTTELNINSKFFEGRTLDEINKHIARFENNLPQTLEEAVIHECGHAKAYYGKSIEEIVKMNEALKNKGVDGISKIALKDGAECIAETEVLLFRGQKVPEKAMNLYNKYVRRKK